METWHKVEFTPIAHFSARARYFQSSSAFSGSPSHLLHGRLPQSQGVITWNRTVTWNKGSMGLLSLPNQASELAPSTVASAGAQKPTEITVPRRGQLKKKLLRLTSWDSNLGIGLLHPPSSGPNPPVWSPVSCS